MTSKKYRLLLVDDERDILETISAAMPWEKYNIELIGLCDNAIEALERIQTDKPDLVVTDVKMPLVNGIELIFRARELGCHAEFIVLSGFDEFEFAQSAMSQGVKYYLLKPCSEEDLADALQKAERDRDRWRYAHQAMCFQNRAFPVITDHFVPTLWNPNREKTSQLLRELVESTEGQLYLAMMEAEPGEMPYQIWEKGMPWRGKLLPPIILMQRHICVLWLSQTSKQPEPALQELESFLCAKQLKVAPISLESLPETINEIETEPCQFFHVGGEEQGEEQPSQNEIQIEELIEQIEQTLTQTESTQRDQLHKMAEKYGESVLIVAVVRVLLKYKSSFSEISSLFNGLYEDVGEDVLINLLIKALKTVSEEKGEEPQSFVEEVLNYIDEHLNESNLTLRRIANEVVFRNEDYVGKAFYAHTGENFSSYLNHRRMEHAKFLIQTMGENKFYKVAEQIGLGHNPHYFSKLFKKYTGMTPKEYKKFCQREGRDKFSGED